MDISRAKQVAYQEFQWLKYLVQHPSRLERYFKSRKLSKSSVDEILDTGLPWLPYSLIDWLEIKVDDTKKFFEWGSGGSTIYFCKRAMKVVSIEHDKKWHNRLVEKLGKEAVNCSVELRTPSNIRSANEKKPEIYKSLKLPSKIFDKYCKAIEEYSSGYFDIVLVDGRARNSCIYHALDKVAERGYLILDDSNRERYRKGIRMVKEWEREDFSGPRPFGSNFANTSVFKKPKKTS